MRLSRRRDVGSWLHRVLCVLTQPSTLARVRALSATDGEVSKVRVHRHIVLELDLSLSQGKGE